MKVLINGTGNIGTTLACLLVDFKQLLNIKEIYIYKNLSQNWKKPDLLFLEQKGIKIFYSTDISLAEAIHSMDYVFETTANKIGNKNKELYLANTSLKGVCAQGSEKDFGIPFISGINDASIAFEKFSQIVSCNTHGAASILNILTGKKLENLLHADFVVVRRSEDIGNHERLVGANVVARHLSTDNGTHHAIDVKDMYQTIGINCAITSSDITTPSQLLHSTRFNIEFKNKIDRDFILNQLQTNTFVATTQKFDSNQIFELGRRYGKYGRIYNHSIVVTNNLLFTEKSVKGWAFVPQEGNTLISTIHSFLIQLYGYKKARKSIEIIKQSLLYNTF